MKAQLDLDERQIAFLRNGIKALIDAYENTLSADNQQELSVIEDMLAKSARELEKDRVKKL